MREERDALEAFLQSFELPEIPEGAADRILAPARRLAATRRDAVGWLERILSALASLAEDARLAAAATALFLLLNLGRDALVPAPRLAPAGRAIPVISREIARATGQDPRWLRLALASSAASTGVGGLRRTPRVPAGGGAVESGGAS